MTVVAAADGSRVLRKHMLSMAAQTLNGPLEQLGDDLQQLLGRQPLTGSAGPAPAVQPLHGHATLTG